MSIKPGGNIYASQFFVIISQREQFLGTRHIGIFGSTQNTITFGTDTIVKTLYEWLNVCVSGWKNLSGFSAMHTYAYRNCFGVGLNLGGPAQIPYVWVTHLAYTDWFKIYFSEFQIFVKTKVGHRAKTRKNPKLFWGRTKFGRSSPNSVFLGYPLSLHRVGA